MQGEPVIVGRDDEIALALRVLGSPRGALLISGDAGIGKTRFIRAIADRLSADEMLVLVGHCLPVASHLPLLPVVEILRSLATDPHSAMHDVRRSAPSFVDRELARVIPELAVGDPAGPGEGWERERLFAALALVVDRCSAIRRLVLVVEDAHWADPTTRDFLSYLLAQPRVAGPNLVVTTRRRPDLGSDAADWMDLVQRLPDVTSLGLGPLDVDAVAHQVEHLLPAPLSAMVADDVARRSEGNPFFVEQLARSYAGEGDADGPSAPLPDSLSESLRRRVNVVSPTARRLTDAMSVAGRPLADDALAAICELSASEVQGGLRELADFRLVRNLATSRGNEMGHVLLAEAVVDGLLEGERAALHVRLGGLLDRTADPSDAAEAAGHWRAARRPAQELDATVRAARHAETLYSQEEAAELWQRGAELAAAAQDSRHDPLPMYVSAARSWEGAGDSARAYDVATRGRALVAADTDPVVAGQILMWAGATSFVVDREQTVAVGAEAVRELRRRPPSPELAEALLRLDLSYMTLGRVADGEPYVHEAADIAERIGDRALLTKAWARLGNDYWTLGRLDEARAAFERVRSIAASMPDAVTGLLWIVAADTDLGLKRNELERVVTQGTGDLRLLRASGHQSDVFTRLLTANIAEALLELGRVSDADAVLTADLPPMTAAAEFLYGVRARIELCLGDLAAAHDLVTRVIQAGTDPPAEMQRERAMDLAEVLLWHREPAAARDVAVAGLQAAAGTDEVERCAPLFVCAMRAAADLAAVSRARRATTVEDLDALLSGWGTDPFEQEAWDVTCPLLGVIWKAEHARALGRSDPDSWQRVAEAWRDLGRPHRYAYARWRQAEALVLGGAPRDGIGDILGDAAESARNHVPLRQAIESLSEAARIPLPRPADLPPVEAHPERPFGLTGRELQVLRLVARGLTNADIGAQLYLSPKTVSVHMTGILRKLDATSRSQAAWVATQAGLFAGDRG